MYMYMYMSLFVIEFVQSLCIFFYQKTFYIQCYSITQGVYIYVKRVLVHVSVVYNKKRYVHVYINAGFFSEKNQNQIFKK